MAARRRETARLVDGTPSSAPSPERTEEFSRQVTLAENVNLRERVGRLEASMAFWAADLDEATAETQRLRGENEALKRRLREAEDRLATSEDRRAHLAEELSERDDHIAGLESRIVETDLAEIDAHRTRSRLHALRRRVRARMTAQAEEIDGLRRTLALGHAARSQVEAELREARLDAKRNARYLDKLEERLAATRRRGSES